MSGTIIRRAFTHTTVPDVGSICTAGEHSLTEGRTPVHRHGDDAAMA